MTPDRRPRTPAAMRAGAAGAENVAERRDPATLPLAADDAAQLAGTLDLLDAVLGERLLGAYLHGSAALGTLRSRSDLDILGIVSRRTTPAERARIVEGLLAISGRTTPHGRQRRLEVTLVAADDIHPWRYPPHVDLLYGDWLRDRFAAGCTRPEGDREPDLAITLRVARDADMPVAGPPPAALLPAVPDSDVRDAMVAGLEGLLADAHGDEANVVLTLARILVTLRTGRITTKDGAADLVLPTLAPELRPPLEHARAVYLGRRPDEWDESRDELAAHLAAVADAIRQACP